MNNRDNMREKKYVKCIKQSSNKHELRMNIIDCVEVHNLDISCLSGPHIIVLHTFTHVPTHTIYYYDQDG